MVKRGTWLTIGIIVLIILVVVSIVYFQKSPTVVDEQTAKCIGGNSTLYTKSDCFYCKKQKDIFGENVKFLNIAEIGSWEELAKYNVTETPTWIINNQKYSGVKSIEDLKELTSC